MCELQLRPIQHRLPTLEEFQLASGAERRVLQLGVEGEPAVVGARVGIAGAVAGDVHGLGDGAAGRWEMGDGVDVGAGEPRGVGAEVVERVEG